jgi:hypothetical protein
MIRSVRVITMTLAMATLGVGAPPSAIAQSGARVTIAGKLEHKRSAPEYLASLPDDVDAVVALRSLSRLRTSSAGGFALDLLGAEAFEPVREGWSDLAQAMGLSSERAFDAVLGDRVVLAIRRTDSPLPDWTIQTSVSAKTEQLLRKRLKVAPRTIVAGQTLYAVERGALELTVARAAEGSASARVVLAPAGSRLFEDIVRGRAKDAPSVVDTPMGRTIFDAPSGDVFVLARLRERADAWAALVGRVDDDSFVADVRGSLSHDNHEHAACSGWTSDQAGALANGALVAVFDSRASALAEVGDVLGEALPKQLLAIFKDNEALTGREAMLIVTNDEGAPAVVSAVELNNMEQGARLGDDAMDQILEMAGLTPRRFEGVAPLATRRVEQGPISLGWAFVPVADDADTRAWWIYSTDSSQLDAARAAFVLASPDPEGLRAAAFVRPAEFIGALTRLGAPIPSAIDAFARVESIEWVESHAPEKVLDARLVVRFVARRDIAIDDSEPSGASR